MLRYRAIEYAVDMENLFFFLLCLTDDYVNRVTESVVITLLG